MRFERWIALLAVGLVAATPASATAGLAEWEIFTPGGHLISHTDLWKDAHGDCLRSDARPDVSRSRIFVSHLKRWRYYRDHVVGEAGDSWFLFDEKLEIVEWLASRRELQAAIEARRLGDPESPWLTGADGWRESWFPFMVWKPCRALLSGEPSPATLSVDECREALAPERLELYRRTTWGRTCGAWRTRGLPRNPATELLNAFCDVIE